MKTIRLNWLLVIMVLFSGMAALVISAALALYDSDSSSRKHAEDVTQIVKKQLDWQVLKLDNQIMSRDHFPDFFLWKRGNSFNGLCVIFETPDGEVARSLCSGEATEEVWPLWFADLYLHLFDPAMEVHQKLHSKEQVEGVIRVAPSTDAVLFNAWQKISNLMSFSVLTVLILCVILVVSLHWVLKPVKDTQKILKDMRRGNLDTRVPDFRIYEWQETAEAINKLASNLSDTLNEHKQLSLKMLHIQENERRHLCRELHDELGQSLTGLRAIACFMESEVKESCPQLSTKVGQISLISQHMMELVKGLLFRLRPVDIDELGFLENLKLLIGNWNSKHQDKHCKLIFSDSQQEVPAPVAINVLRIVQECLTNIVKHASANEAEVKIRLDSEQEQLFLTIWDNGNKTCTEELVKPGNGLLGIKERVNALNGELKLERSALGGLMVGAVIPIQEYEGTDEAH
ncbi:MAG: HAMP domain-containing sensor histidine kinase [Neptuniibacter sp.]